MTLIEWLNEYGRFGSDLTDIRFHLGVISVKRSEGWTHVYGICYNLLIEAYINYCLGEL